MKQLQYKFYATLLDAFQGYLSSSEIYQQYWGFSENPKLTEEEFEKEQFQGLIDKINRVPFDSEAADKGTAFNEVIDCLIDFRKSDKMEILSVNTKNKQTIQANYNGRTFVFDTQFCKDIAARLSGALTQQFTEAVLHTKYGDVLLYGYLDELMPFKIVDLKTTKKYNAFKFRNNWQHIVYPFCLNQNDIYINQFDYLVTDFRNVYEEVYYFDADRDIPKLVQHCESFIDFLEMNRDKITDTKVFALDELEVVS